jgi:hypothetical protein
MYNKDMLIGIILSLGKLNFNISRDDSRKIGYSVRLILNFRANITFLEAVKRSLEQHGIGSKLKIKEHSSRPKPILKITGNKNIIKVSDLLPNLPHAKGDLIKLKQVVELIRENKHITAEGIEEIFKIKGVI